MATNPDTEEFERRSSRRMGNVVTLRLTRDTYDLVQLAAHFDGKRSMNEWVIEWIECGLSCLRDSIMDDRDTSDKAMAFMDKYEKVDEVKEQPYV